MKRQVSTFLVVVAGLVAEIKIGNTAQQDFGINIPQRKVHPAVWQKALEHGTVRIIVALNVPEWVSRNGS
jgi:hypothetical protein